MICNNIKIKNAYDFLLHISNIIKDDCCPCDEACPTEKEVIRFITSFYEAFPEKTIDFTEDIKKDLINFHAISGLWPHQIEWIISNINIITECFKPQTDFNNKSNLILKNKFYNYNF